MRAKQTMNKMNHSSRMSWKRRIGLGGLLAAVLTFLLGSCVDNEISFFVEHVKVQPQSPACTYTESDDYVAAGLFDVMFGNGYRNGYLVKNQLMSREDYDNLKAENAGILVDSYEVSFRTADTNEEIGSSERFPNNFYIEPESSIVLIAEVIPSDVAMQIASDNHCLELTRENYPPEAVYEEGVDRNNREVGRSLGILYTRIKFFGHSQGGDEVETQVYTFPIELCCGCLVDWQTCGDPCDRYCTDPDDFEESDMCIEGVDNGDNKFDCRPIYYNIQEIWDCQVYSSGGDPLWLDDECSCPETCGSD